MMVATTFDQTVPPTGAGCVECLTTGGWWFHLRRCATCGHIGCCDSSSSQHASAHAARPLGRSIVRTRRELVMGLPEQPIRSRAPFAPADKSPELPASPRSRRRGAGLLGVPTALAITPDE
ncbi:MAG: hypothetical protein QOE41_3940 [Mycobacterium sp.]|nr:hypothetical protein [Mycobacterium sp.]